MIFSSQAIGNRAGFSLWACWRNDSPDWIVYMVINLREPSGAGILILLHASPITMVKFKCLKILGSAEFDSTIY